MAKDAFEKTLEVIASLALQLHDKGCAVGLVTNGVLTGGGSCVLYPNRASGQLPAILEALARLQLSQTGEFEPIMFRTLGSRRGVSCACFSYKPSRVTAGIQKYCQRHKIPLTFFVCHSDLASEPIRPKSKTAVHTLDEICIQENGLV